MDPFEFQCGTKMIFGKDGEKKVGQALSAFGADGLEFTVGFWIADPENGSLGLRSDINRAILSALRAHQIEIPYPQRVMHVQVDGAVPAAMSPGGTPAPAPASAG